MLFPHPNLLRYYPLHGDWLDRSGRGYDLTPSGAFFVQGKMGLAAYFDGVDDFATAAGTGLPGATKPSTATWCMWIRRDLVAATYGYLLSYGTAANAGFKLGSSDASDQGIFSGTPSNGYTSVGVIPIPIGDFCFLSYSTLMQTGANVNTPPGPTNGVNGQIKFDGAPGYPSEPPDSATFNLGRQQSTPTTNTWKGTIEEFSVWNIRLSPPQVREVMQGRNPII